MDSGSDPVLVEFVPELGSLLDSDRVNVLAVSFLSDTIVFFLHLKNQVSR